MTTINRSWLAAVFLGLTITGAASAQEVEITEKARQHFRAGVNFLQDPDGARYEEAYRQFKAAYAESPSWKILGNLGITAMKLERDGEAIWAFEKYLAESGENLDPAERAQVQRDLQTLKASVAYVEISSNPSGATVTDQRIPLSGEPVVNRYGPLEAAEKVGLRAGRHRLTARLPGHEEVTWEVDLQAGGEAQTHVFELPKTQATPEGGGGGGGGEDVVRDQQMERPVPTGVYIGLAATGVLAVGAGVTGVMAMGKNSDFDSANDGSDPTAAESLRDEGQSLNLVTDVLLGAAVVAGGVTAYLYFSRPEVPAERDTARVRVSPAIGPTGGGLSVTGSF